MKFQLPKLNTKKFGQYSLLVVFSSLLLVTIGYSLPQTEKYLKFPQSDVVLNDSNLWSKQFRVEVSIDSTQSDQKWKLINQAKNTLYTRLSKYGVEFVRIDYKDTGENKGEILVTVQTTKEEAKVKSLIESKGDMKVVIKKVEVSFEDEKQPYAAYMPENYDDTNLSRSDFRTIYVTLLKTTGGEDSYFGILKPWIWNNAKYDKFLLDNAAKSGGINTDGFVTPVTIPVYTGSSVTTAKPIFAFSLGTDAHTALIQEIIYNSGSIPLNYTYKDVSDVNAQSNYNYYVVFGLMIGCIILSLILGSYISNLNIFTSAFAIFVSFILLVDFLKVTQTPILSISLLVSLAFALLYTIVLSTYKDKWIVTLSIGIMVFLMAIPLKTQFVVFAPVLLYFVTSIPIVTYLNEKYLELFTKTLRK